jgi:hypothetical protein
MNMYDLSDLVRVTSGSGAGIAAAGGAGAGVEALVVPSRILKPGAAFASRWLKMKNKAVANIFIFLCL